MKNCNLQITMFPSLQVIKCMQVLHKITICKLQNNIKKITSQKFTIHKLKYYNEKFRNVQHDYIVTNCEIEICNWTVVNFQIFKCENLHRNNFVIIFARYKLQNYKIVNLKL
jgi:hypothetical protein